MMMQASIVAICRAIGLGGHKVRSGQPTMMPMAPRDRLAFRLLGAAGTSNTF